jgi:hypothetical protein
VFVGAARLILALIVGKHGFVMNQNYLVNIDCLQKPLDSRQKGRRICSGKKELEKDHVPREIFRWRPSGFFRFAGGDGKP